MALAQQTIALSQIEYQRRKYQALSLTHFDDTLEPEIAAGGRVEVADALFYAAGNEAILGWGAIGVSNSVWIKLIPAGTTPDTVTAEFTTVAPVWTDSKQGYYGVGGFANNRYIGGLYKDAGGNYTEKWLYNERKTTNFKIGTSSRDAAGAQVITGVGFKPSAVIFLAVEGGAPAEFSAGFDNGIDHMCIYMMDDAGATAIDTALSITVRRDVGNKMTGYISTLSSDGFTITWTELGVCTCWFVYMCLP